MHESFTQPQRVKVFLKAGGWRGMSISAVWQPSSFLCSQSQDRVNISDGLDPPLVKIIMISFSLVLMVKGL